MRYYNTTRNGDFSQNLSKSTVRMAQSSSGTLQVFVRVRPPILREVELESAAVVKGNSISVVGGKHDISCVYDCVFDEVTAQEEFFRNVVPPQIFFGYHGMYNYFCGGLN